MFLVKPDFLTRSPTQRMLGAQRIIVCCTDKFVSVFNDNKHKHGVAH